MREFVTFIALAGLLASPLAAQTRAVVVIDNMQFAPAVLKLRRGDTVVWRNQDLVPHTSTSPGHWDSGAIAPGASWSWVAKNPGRYEYVCTFHPGMKAALEVR